MFTFLGLEASWYTSALGAQLSWTLPFGVLVMFAVMSRSTTSGKRRPAISARRDADRAAWWWFRSCCRASLRWRSSLHAVLWTIRPHAADGRPLNTLPLEIWSMTLNVTSPSLYALGTVSTVVSFVIIGARPRSIAWLQKRRATAGAATEMEKDMKTVRAKSS